MAIAARAIIFLGGSSAHGGALIHQERRVIAAASASPSACSQAARGDGSAASASQSGTPRGLLEAPSLGLVAPVSEGTSDAVLADAVGHVRASAWPGDQGTTVLAAHDVTWFSSIDQLRPGDEISYVTACHTYTYRVTAHRVVATGYPVYNTTWPSLVLDTCYPLDALYTTPTRYLVYATLASVAPNSASQLPSVKQAAIPTVPAPRALARQGLSLARNNGPVGVLRFSGSPSAAWRQANTPLDAEAAALTAYFGVIHSASQGERAWWRALAPAVPVPAAAGLWDGSISGYSTRLDVTLHVVGDRLLGATLTAGVITAGSAQPGTYDLTVTETVTGKDLLVTGFSMRPAG